MSDQAHPRILLVEDNPQDVFLFRAALARGGLQGVQLMHAERVADALRIIQRNSVDLIVTDLNLPDSGGVETVRAFAGTPEHVPILVLTGYTDADSDPEIFRNGASAHVSKDLLPTRAFTDVIRKVLSERS